MERNNLIRWNAIVLSFPILFAGCGDGGKTNESLILQSTTNVTAPSQKISNEAIGEIIESIPSPIEISVLIKESGGDYNSSILNSKDNASNYNSNFKRAINLGVYGTDLGYINIYNKSKDALVYLASIRGLANDLNIGQFYDFETIKRLATNSKNVDSLLNITTSSFEKINEFLHKQKRSEQSVLILTGGWLEALHISCKVAAMNKNPKLYEKIGEQKIVLDQLVLLLSNFDNDKNVKLLEDRLLELQKIFNKIEITYTYKESSMEEVDGVLVVVDKSESKVNITDQQVNAISNLTNSIRNEIIGS